MVPRSAVVLGSFRNFASAVTRFLSVGDVPIPVLSVRRRERKKRPANLDVEDCRRVILAWKAGWPAQKPQAGACRPVPPFVEVTTLEKLSHPCQHAGQDAEEAFPIGHLAGQGPAPQRKINHIHSVVAPAMPREGLFPQPVARGAGNFPGSRRSFRPGVVPRRPPKRAAAARISGPTTDRAANSRNTCGTAYPSASAQTPRRGSAAAVLPPTRDGARLPR